MCGRINVDNELVDPWVMDNLGIDFHSQTNHDLCPSQSVAVIIKSEDSLKQLDTVWGIKPAWSKKLIINAQGETVADKQTFKQSFNLRRCIIPCTSWYEWRTEKSAKHKYQFSHADDIPLLMAGIWFEAEGISQLVTLTTHPNELCAQYHRRMPVNISHEDVDFWFNSSVENLKPLIEPIHSDLIRITQQ